MSNEQRTTTPQTEAQRLAALINATLDSQDDSYLTCSVTKGLLQQAVAELRRLDSIAKATGATHD